METGIEPVGNPFIRSKRHMSSARTTAAGVDPIQFDHALMGSSIDLFGDRHSRRTAS